MKEIVQILVPDGASKGGNPKWQQEDKDEALIGSVYLRKEAVEALGFDPGQPVTVTITQD